MVNSSSTIDGVVVFVPNERDYQRIARLGYKCVNREDYESGFYGALEDMKDTLREGRTTIATFMSKNMAEAVHGALRQLNLQHVPVIEITAEVGTEDMRIIKEGSDEEFGTLLKEKVLDKLDPLSGGRASLLAARGVHSMGDAVLTVSSGGFVRECMPTGIGALDNLLDGGLPRGGVVVIGAISSAGKTSLCLQMSDNYARGGTPVLFATLEQSRYELAVMSLSRIIGMAHYDYGRLEPAVIEAPGEVARHEGGGFNAGFTFPTRQVIQKGKWSTALEEAIMGAGAEYLSFADAYMHVMETDEPPTVSEIRGAAETVRAVHNGVSPIVMVDYLQLLSQPEGVRDERLAVNKNMSGLRRLARDLETVVVVVSALNRASLHRGVVLNSFRESGGIEYAGDLVLGMQPTSLTEKLEDLRRSTTTAKELKDTELDGVIDEFRDSTIKKVDVKVLKNRAGSTPKEPAHLLFDGRVSYFFDEGDVVSHTFSAETASAVVEDDFVPITDFLGANGVVDLF